MFGRATIRLSIGPHSSYHVRLHNRQNREIEGKEKILSKRGSSLFLD